MIRWGISAGTHDASLCVVADNIIPALRDNILFASHSERFSGRKNDKDLNWSLLAYAEEFGKPDIVHWYENPYKKWMRKIYARQSDAWLNPKKYLLNYNIDVPVQYSNHHESHAAAGYYTSPFEESAILVVDAIGEWKTISIWQDMKLLWSENYPTSLGLFYSAMTDRVGLKPNEDEYILMGMSAYGDPDRFYDDLLEMSVYPYANFHRGCRWWRPELKENDYFDVAAATQKVYETHFKGLLEKTRRLTSSNNLVFMGGCALNCLANRHINKYFDAHWIMPNPGDAGSSLGAIVAKTRKKVYWKTPYLGFEIAGHYPWERALRVLLKDGIVGIASGRAEFGPRALGNRSLLADPSNPKMKDIVNKIKKRQEFRPFAPVIRQEDVSRYFDVSHDFASPYMQHVVKCRTPNIYPSIVHEDGTSRVQTVTKFEHIGLYDLLTSWYDKTGCPMLLNTSLNIKGKPIVNQHHDALNFQREYGVTVCGV